MTADEKEALLRQYAAGDITWTSLRGRGIDNYRDVLAGLGELGLRRSRPWKGRMSRSGVALALLFGRLCNKRNLNEPAWAARHGCFAAYHLGGGGCA